MKLYILLGFIIKRSQAFIVFYHLSNYYMVNYQNSECTIAIILIVISFQLSYLIKSLSIIILVLIILTVYISLMNSLSIRVENSLKLVTVANFVDQFFLVFTVVRSPLCVCAFSLFPMTNNYCESSFNIDRTIII